MSRTLIIKKDSGDIDLSTDHLVPRAGWQIETPAFNRGLLAGRPYSDVSEVMLVKGSEANAGAIYSFIEDFSEAAGDIENFRQESEGATAVTIEYSPEGSTLGNSVQALVTSASPPKPSPRMEARATQGDATIEFEFMRRGAWIGASENATGGGATNHPSVYVGAFTADAKVRCPIDLTVSGFASAVRVATPPAMYLVCGGNDSIELAHGSSFSGSRWTTTDTDDVIFSALTADTTTQSATHSLSFTEKASQLIVVATVLNNSADDNFLIRAAGVVGSRTFHTAWFPITGGDYRDSTAVVLGVVRATAPITGVRLEAQEVGATGGNLQIGQVACMKLREDAYVIRQTSHTHFTNSTPSSARSIKLEQNPLTSLEPSLSAVYGNDSFLSSHRGNLNVWSRDRYISACYLSADTDESVGTTVTKKTHLTTGLGGATKENLSYAVSRKMAYLLPQ